MVTLTYQERFKTLRGVFDNFTERTLFSLHSKGVFDELVSPLEVGKESNVFIAVKDGKKVIVKIYRMQNCDFNQMYDYIQKDPRYEFLKKQRRSIIIAWTQREYKNLLKAEKANISAPKAISWKNHIVVEEFIGDENAAPQLKDTIPLDPEKFFEKIIIQLKNLFDAGLIHGDLSAFNILNHHNKPVLIDFSQATLTKTPNSPELLKRDIKNLLQFFRKLGIHKDEEKVFKRITERE